MRIEKNTRVVLKVFVARFASGSKKEEDLHSDLASHSIEN